MDDLMKLCTFVKIGFSQGRYLFVVDNHDKAENKCYTQDNTDTRENPPKYVNRCQGRVNFTCCDHVLAVKILDASAFYVLSSFVVL